MNERNLYWFPGFGDFKVSGFRGFRDVAAGEVVENGVQCIGDLLWMLYLVEVFVCCQLMCDGYQKQKNKVKRREFTIGLNFYLWILSEEERKKRRNNIHSI